MLKKYYNYTSSLFNLIKYRIKNSKVPLFAALGVTNRCNYRCTYCYGDYYNQKKDNFSTEELLNIIDTLNNMGTRVLNLIGGEPLMRDDIGVLIERVKDRGMICNLSTNASLLPQKIGLVQHVDAIDTSLDGLEKNNDNNRGKGTFYKTLEGIKCSVAKNIKTNVNMVLTKYNIDDIDDMVSLASKTGFTLSFNIVFESHCFEYVNYQDSMAIKSKDDMQIKNALHKIILYKQKGYPIRFSQDAYNYALNWPHPYSEKVFVTKKDSLMGIKPIKCFFSQFHCYIDTDGRIYNCLHLKDNTPDINIRQYGLDEAWKKVSSIKPPCFACYTICNNDANLIFGLNPSTLFSTVKDIVS